MRVSDLHHWACVDKQTGQFSRLGERTAPICTQINHDPGDFFGAQLIDEFVDVARGAAITLVAAHACLEVHVESGYFDDPEFYPGTALRHFQDFFLRGLVVELNRVAREFDKFGHAIRAGAFRQYLQHNLGIFGAAD